jgi:putative hydrolase of the HAD superfamily
MIKAIIFDVGGVLIRTQDHRPRRALEKKLGLRPWESEEIVFAGSAGTSAQLGKISHEELWQSIGSRLQLSEGQLREFRNDFWSGDVLDTALVSLIRNLQDRYQTAIISNATDDLRRQLREDHQIADAFDLIVCSAEERIMKPNPDIYHRTLSRLQRKPVETIFIDDASENVAAARKIGMHAIHFQEDLALPERLSQLGIRIPESENHPPDLGEVNGGKHYA